MPKYIIMWDAGYGRSTQVQEYANDSEAQDAAYDEWHQEAEGQADYHAVLLTPESAAEYECEDELETD